MWRPADAALEDRRFQEDQAVSRRPLATWLALVIALIPFTDLHAKPQNRAHCEALYLQERDRYGKDVVWIATPDEFVRLMLTIAKTTEDDFVLDLGAGDGKIVIAGAKEFGDRGLGVEYEPDLVNLARCLVEVEGVADKVQIREGDIFKEDFGHADVVTLFLTPRLNLCIRHRLLAMDPGTRIVSHDFRMDDWVPDDWASIDPRTAHVWIVPARAGGLWRFEDRDGKHVFDLTLAQSFQWLRGEAEVGGSRRRLRGARLRGDAIEFAFEDGEGVVRTLAGTIREREITGTLSVAGGADVRVTGTVQGAIATGAWTEMAPGCDKYYAR